MKWLMGIYTLSFTSMEDTRFRKVSCTSALPSPRRARAAAAARWSANWVALDSFSWLLCKSWSSALLSMPPSIPFRVP